MKRNFAMSTGKKDLESDLIKTEQHLCEAIGNLSTSIQPFQEKLSGSINSGRTVRDFEDQMSSLRKDNFNLKLRLYYYEESLPGCQHPGHHNPDSILKKLIDSKVAMEMLKDEIQQKQDLLKEAAQAIEKMEKSQKETEDKCNEIIEEMQQKIRRIEKERDMVDTTKNEFLDNLLSNDDIINKFSADEKLNEMETIIKGLQDKLSGMHIEVKKLTEIIAKRDQTIVEYEEKLKELAFQNSEILETLENRERDFDNSARIIQSLRQTNTKLKDDQHNLQEVLQHEQETFHAEITRMQMCEQQLREQQRNLEHIQSTFTAKTKNTNRLLERIQDYEKMLMKINVQSNIARNENRFFRAIIDKLQRNKKKYLAIENEFYQRQLKNENKKTAAIDTLTTKRLDMAKYEQTSGCDIPRGVSCKVKEKFSANFSNTTKFEYERGFHKTMNQPEAMNQSHSVGRNRTSEYAIRYSLNSGNLCREAIRSNTYSDSSPSSNDWSTRHSNFSGSTILGKSRIDTSTITRTSATGISTEHDLNNQSSSQYISNYYSLKFGEY